MKHIIYILLSAAVFLGCSSGDEEEDVAMCCREPKSEILEHINTEFPRLLSMDLSDEQRRMIEAEYREALEDPCEFYRKELEAAGATCNGPH